MAQCALRVLECAVAGKMSSQGTSHYLKGDEMCWNLQLVSDRTNPLLEEVLCVSRRATPVSNVQATFNEATLPVLIWSNEM